MPFDLVDIGANLTAAAFAGDRDQVIARAIAAGVRRMIVTGSTVADSEQAQGLTGARPGTLWSTVGIHPHHAVTADAAALAALRRLAAAPKVVAIGECGLDFYRDLSPRPVQIAAFEQQLQLAAELGKPVFVHERDAAAAMREVMSHYRAALPRAVVHCFTGDGAALRAYLDLDLHIGVTGWICDERRGAQLRELVRLVPSDRLMLETDAPYLLPRSITPKPAGGRNEPALLVHVLAAVAACVGRPVAQVAAATTHTAEQFFAIVD